MQLPRLLQTRGLRVMNPSHDFWWTLRRWLPAR